MAWLRHLDCDRGAKVEYAFIAEEKGTAAAALQAFIVEGVIVGSPAQVNGVEIGRDTHAATQRLCLMKFQRFAGETIPYGGNRVVMLSDLHPKSL
jgi:hypothetical protein